MDVNNINPNVNNLQNLNPQSNLERLEGASSIKNDDEESYKLSISSLLTHDRSNLALGLEQANTGLAITKITQNTLQNQDKILDKIENKLEKNDNQNLKREDINEIKNQLSEFSSNTNNAKFENKKVFAADWEESVITLSLENNSLQINKSDLRAVTSDLITKANNLPVQEEAFRVSIKEAKEVIASYSSEYKTLENNIQEFAKESLHIEENNRDTNTSLKNVNFANEAKDFTKTNINANIGLIAAQANIVQEQSVRLLSK